MSNADTRQAIADALSSVPNVAGYRSRPTSINTGDGWPQWRGATPVADAFENTWSVLIALPAADDVAADAFVDEHGPALVEALSPVMYVDTLAPATLDTEAGPMYALLITGRSE